ncbi:MAG TPA: UTRA domain-containing protein, partial [Chloroflexota bacterium]|nr:UTRA domain-containing protein [Chloroflexota bacterium]
RLIRKRLVDDVPLALETAEVPLSVCPDLATVDLGDESLYEFVEAHSALLISGASETIRPALLSREGAELLGVPANSAAFDVQRITSAGEQVVEWRHSMIRGDCYLYSVDLPRRGVVGSPSGEPTNTITDKILQTSKTTFARWIENPAAPDLLPQHVG